MCWKRQFFLLPWVQHRQVLSRACCPLAPCPVCVLTCGHRLPVLLKTRANKAMHQTLWGGRSAGARGQPPRKRRRWQSFALQLFGNENLAGIWHRDLLQPWQLWCVGLVFMAHGWSVAGSHLCFLLFCFLQSSLPSISVPTFSILEVMYFLSRNVVRLGGCVNHTGSQGW